MPIFSGGGGGGSSGSGELDYVTVTTAVVVVVGSGSPATVITNNPIGFSGNTTVYVEFQCARVDGGASVTDAAVELLVDGTTTGRFDVVSAAGNNFRQAHFFRKRITPSAGSHTFSWVAWRDAGTLTFQAGDGTGVNFEPISSRVVPV